MKGQILNTYITVYEDKTYTFVTKGTSTSTLIKKKLGIEKGSGEPNKTKVATINQKQLEEIAQENNGQNSANPNPNPNNPPGPIAYNDCII